MYTKEGRKMIIDLHVIVVIAIFVNAIVATILFFKSI